MDIIKELSSEANYKLFDALVTASQELDAKFKLEQLICESDMYSHMFMLMNATARRVFDEDRNKTQENPV